MPNISILLKGEIARVARKELRRETDGLRKAGSSYRADIAALKRRVQDLERQLRQAQRASPRNEKASTQPDSEAAHRFSAKGLAQHRKRLDLSARDVGALVGTSALTIYKWEKGETRPRARYLPAIAPLRRMGKREAAGKLEALR